MDAYKRYLASPHWKAFRLEAIEHFGHKCSMCYGDENLVVHHKHYETLGQEAIDDVMVFCNKCHKLHENNSGFVNIDFQIIKALKPIGLQLYLILRMDAILNHGNSYAEMSYKQIGKWLGCNRNYAVKYVNDLIEYHLITKVKSQQANKYYFEHPEAWDIW